MNTEQLNLLGYRAPKRRKLAAVKVKFGPAEGEPGYGRSMTLWARRGSGEWVDVGSVDIEYNDLNEDIMGDTEDFRVSDYRAVLYVDELDDDGEFDEFDVEVLGYRNRQIRTAVEAKRMIKAWVVETLEAIGWEG